MTPRERLAKRLTILASEHFGRPIVFLPSRIVGTLGHWRKEDCCRWEALSELVGSIHFTVFSYETMTKATSGDLVLVEDSRRRPSHLCAEAVLRHA